MDEATCDLSTGEAEKELGVQYRFYGSMDEILIAKRAFTAEEIAEIYRNGRP